MRVRRETSHGARCARPALSAVVARASKLARALLSRHRMKNQATRQTQETHAEQRAHVHQILAKMSDVMFLSYASVGEAPSVSGRPLRITKLDDDETLWFMVGLDTKKVEEIQRHDGAFITAQDGSRWIHLTGRASVVTDRAKIRALWSTAHEVWFPEGPDDPAVALLRFRPESAEYWDNSGIAGAKYLFEAAKAFLTGTTPEPVKGLHGEVATRT